MNDNVRIYELSRELGLQSKEVLDLCQQSDIEARTACSSVTSLEASQLRAMARNNDLASINSHGAPSNNKPAEQQQSIAQQQVSAAPSSGSDQNIAAPEYYFNREISWLQFNQRVLHEAFDQRTLLLEKLKFLAIYSSNLDEYFMVRVSGLKRLVEAGITQRSHDGLTPKEQLDAIRDQLEPEVARQHRYFNQDLIPQLAEIGICLINYSDLSERQVTYLEQYFLEQIFPVLTPLAVDPGHPFPYISNLSLSLAVIVKDEQMGESHFARVKVPNMLPRFISMPGLNENGCEWVGVTIEQVIAHNLQSLFSGMVIEACYPFRITRNADLDLEEDEADDLLEAIEQELRKRRFGSVVRVEIQDGTPDFMRQKLMQELGLHESDVYAVEGPIGLHNLMGIASLPFPQFKQASWVPTVPKPLQQLDKFDKPMEDDQADIFSVVQERDLLVHHPYESFSATVLRFITQAAHDPDVLTIKMTLYRTDGDAAMVGSPIVSSLIAAAENGKQVIVLVELKARFDEENNIQWARKLEKVGVHVVYGIVGLKIHTKVALVVRREKQRIRRYVHIGTGNYNPKTARLYTDLGLLSCREELGADLTDLFNYLTGFARQQQYRKLLVAPVSLRDRTYALIEREITHQEAGKSGRIIAKMNALIDKKIIMALYRASQAGVEIDLIIRGICSLRPGVPGVSENIRVTSIIGRFLEHDRIFYFENQGDPTVLIGSADWRARNLDRRVEAVVPIEDPVLVTRLYNLLQQMLADTRQAWELQASGEYIQRQAQDNDPGIHIRLMEQALQTSPST
ncbi:MAG: polyphosphate kinase 1 [Cyanobacteria bacterium P01_A01_bin.17]